MTELEELRTRHNEFVHLVQKMRENQKFYFRFRDRKFLEEAKRLEVMVDAEVEKDIEAQRQRRLL